jgi:hypothetical protein
VRREGRQKALEKKEVDKGDEKINFVTTHSAYLPNIKKIPKENFHYIQREGLEDIISEPPRLSLRKRKNLKDLVVDAKPKVERGMSGLCDKPCILCPNVIQKCFFRGKDGREF